MYIYVYIYTYVRTLSLHNIHTQKHTHTHPSADGDRVQVPLPDASIELLPREWSEFVEKKRKWGWWGFNKDRVHVALSKEGGEAPEVRRKA
jgi:hypothetical protein